MTHDTHFRSFGCIICSFPGDTCHSPFETCHFETVLLRESFMLHVQTLPKHEVPKHTTLIHQDMLQPSGACMWHASGANIWHSFKAPWGMSFAQFRGTRVTLLLRHITLRLYYFGRFPCFTSKNSRMPKCRTAEVLK
jgi:hypothetical protein